MKRIACLAFLLVFGPIPAHAEMDVAAMKAVTDAAKALCEKPTDYGLSTNGQFIVGGKIDVSQLFKKMADLGIKGEYKNSVTRTQGIDITQYPRALQGYNDCVRAAAIFFQENFRITRPRPAIPRKPASPQPAAPKQVATPPATAPAPPAAAATKDRPRIVLVDTSGRPQDNGQIYRSLRGLEGFRIDPKPALLEWRTELLDVANETPPPAALIVHLHALRQWYVAFPDREQRAENTMMEGLLAFHRKSPKTMLLMYSSTFPRTSATDARARLKTIGARIANEGSPREQYDQLADDITIVVLPEQNSDIEINQFASLIQSHFEQQ